MLDTKVLREEFSTLHDATAKNIELAANEKRELTSDEKTANEKNFARMESIKSTIEDSKKLAGLKFSDNEVQLPAEPEGKADHVASISVGNSYPDRFSAKKIDREEFSRAVNRWAVTGDMERKFATITTASQSGIVLPVQVGTPVVPMAVNTFRAAHTIYGIQPIKTQNTATLNIPILDASAGGVVSQTANSETEQEPGLTNSISLVCSTYQSGSAWFSNQELQAVDFDLFDATLPSLEYSKELGLESAIASQIITNSGGSISTSVTTATTGGFTYANLVSLNRSLPKKFDQLKVLVLSQTAYAAAEALTDSVGHPILTPDSQNQELKRINGTPVLRSDYFQALGTANNVIGCLFSMVGFRLRDAGPEQVARYTQFPNRPSQSGFNLFAYHAFGYDPQAVALFVNHS